MTRTTSLIVLPLLFGVLLMPQFAAGQARMQPAGDSGKFYVRGLDGEWITLANTDRGDAHVRFVLVLDAGENSAGMILPIDVTITMGDAPYREATEQIVDRMLAVAQDDSRVSDAETADVEAAEEEPDDVEPSDVETDESASTDSPAGLPAAMWRSLKQYALANAASLNRDEARWIVARTTGGPALMTLRPGVLPKRLAQSPLFPWLDVDGDGALAAAEIQSAQQRLNMLDADRNGTIEPSEWPRHSSAVPTVPAAQLTRAGGAKGRDNPDDPFDLDAPFDPDSFLAASVRPKGAVDPKALANADSLEPQLRLTVRLGETKLPRLEVALPQEIETAEKPVDTAEPSGGDTVEPSTNNDDVEAAEVSVADIGDADMRDAVTSDVGETTLVEIAGLELYVTVVASEGAGQGGTSASHQVSVGVAPIGGIVRDAIDTDRDRRLTARELRGAAERLARYDRDDDGRIAADEIPRRYRLLFSVGPTAHALLASDLPLPRPQDESPAGSSAPIWFTTMDLNRDGDLSPTEFLGTADVFAEIDTDADGLISTAEAARLDAESSTDSQ